MQKYRDREAYLPPGSQRKLLLGTDAWTEAKKLTDGMRRGCRQWDMHKKTRGTFGELEWKQGLDKSVNSTRWEGREGLSPSYAS